VKSLQRHLIAAGLVAALGVGAIAQAQPQTPPASAAGRHDPAQMEQFHARMQERMAARMAELKQKLQVSAGQEAAWNTWTAAMKPAPHQRGERGEYDKLTTPERIDRMRALRALRNAEMDKRMDATKGFYAVLTPEQKKTFDAESLRLLRGGKGDMGARHHHG
jgi:periplasmic protein CpxP/Spy